MAALLSRQLRGARLVSMSERDGFQRLKAHPDYPAMVARTLAEQAKALERAATARRANAAPNDGIIVASALAPK